jgi:hypothetical protein
VFSNAEIAVTKRIVVPEFSTLITSSGTFKEAFPETIKPFPALFISTPNALHALIVAIVSRDMSGLIILELPFTREEMKMARCV